jgi:hypothetical protein
MIVSDRSHPNQNTLFVEHWRITKIYLTRMMGKLLRCVYMVCQKCCLFNQCLHIVVLVQ